MILSVLVFLIGMTKTMKIRKTRLGIMLPKLELTLAKGILEVLWFAISKINCILLVLFHKDTSAIKMDILVSM